MEPLVELRGVTKWYGAQQVLRGVELELRAGTVTALLARNGAGKSTLMRILCGLIPRDGGLARVLGRDVEDLDPVRERIAWVTDTSSLPATSRVRDELALARGVRGARWNEERARELLARFELPLDKRVGALSKGLQTRLRLILALACDPELLLLDEPALGLDMFARHDLLEAMIELAAGEGRAILCATHLLDDVERVADRVVFLRDGLVPAQGEVEALRERYRRVRVELAPDVAQALEARLRVDDLLGEAERLIALLGERRLERAGRALLGVKRVAAERGGPPGERVVVMDDFTQGALDELLAATGAKVVEVRRMSLREIYFEVLAGREEAEVTA
jgi:ABC-2 type transport system ATP-binding protein